MDLGGGIWDRHRFHQNQVAFMRGVYYGYKGKKEIQIYIAREILLPANIFNFCFYFIYSGWELQ